VNFIITVICEFCVPPAAIESLMLNKKTVKMFRYNLQCNYNLEKARKKIKQARFSSCSAKLSRNSLGIKGLKQVYLSVAGLKTVSCR